MWSTKKRAVNQYDKQGHYLRTFGSIAEAKRITGIVSITGVLRNDSFRYSAGGYQWKYDTGNHEDISPACGPGRSVLQIDPVTGQTVQEFPSLTEAAKAIGISRQSIFLNCKGDTIKTGGFFWRYADSPDEKKAAPAAKKDKPAPPSKKTQPKKTAFIIQSPTGGEIKLESILAKIGVVDKVYIRADVNKAYWVRDEESGEVDLW